MVKTKNGFSLIELIVVITIMMVVTVVGIVSYSGAQKSARDGRRKADLEKIRVAAELYKQENGTYPANQAGFGAYITWPTDPKGYNYVYTQGATGYTYTIQTYLENGGTFAGGSGCGAPSNCNYQVTNP